MNTTSSVDCYRARYQALKQARAPWVHTWKELSAYLAPTRGVFTGEVPNSGRRIDHKTLLDSSGSLAGAQRYLRMYYTVTGTVTAGELTCFVADVAEMR